MQQSSHLAFGAILAVILLEVTLCASAANPDSSHQNNCTEVNAYRMAVAYQRSAEVQALQLQAYNTARRRLDQILSHPQGQPPAIVLDIDDTVISNTPLEMQGLKQCFNYTNWGKHWQAWVHEAHAALIPGAGEFLHYADQRGVKIFYVSNRIDENKDATIKNLNKLDLPQVSAKSVMLMPKSKKARRMEIKKNYDIVMLFGDNLHDFADLFDVHPAKARHAAVTRNADKFGSRYIILPNSAYGAWTPAYGAWQKKHLKN